jgi:RNA polymerase sigma-70 factor (ECF subfamily)
MGSNAAATEADLLRRAIDGERLALELLLLRYYSRLRNRIARKIPADVRTVVAIDDIIQATYVEAIRHIDTFEPQGEQAFYRWLATIAERKLIDAVRVRRGRTPRAKRPPRPSMARSVVALLELLIAPGRSPSRAAAGTEAVQAVQVALASLPEPYRRALWLRYIHGWSVSAIAVEMGRSERGVHGLCNRGLKLLRDFLGSASRFLTQT